MSKYMLSATDAACASKISEARMYDTKAAAVEAARRVLTGDGKIVGGRKIVDGKYVPADDAIMSVGDMMEIDVITIPTGDLTEYVKAWAEYSAACDAYDVACGTDDDDAIAAAAADAANGRCDTYYADVCITAENGMTRLTVGPRGGIRTEKY